MSREKVGELLGKDGLELEADWPIEWKQAQARARVRLLRSRVKVLAKSGERKSKSLEWVAAFWRGKPAYVFVVLVVLVYLALSGHWLSGGQSGSIIGSMFGGGSDVPITATFSEPVVTGQNSASGSSVPTVDGAVLVNGTVVLPQLETVTPGPGILRVPTRTGP